MHQIKVTSLLVDSPPIKLQDLDDSFEPWKMNLVAYSSLQDMLYVACKGAALVKGYCLSNWKGNNSPLLCSKQLKYIPKDSQNEEDLSLVGGAVSINFLYSGTLGNQEVIGAVDCTGNVVLWRMSSSNSKEKQSQEPFIHLMNNGVSSWGMATSSKHSLVAVSGNDHQIRIWNTVSAFGGGNEDFSKPIISLSGHHHNIPCIRFSECGQFLVSCSIDGSFWIWSLKEEERGGEKVGNERISFQALYSNCVNPERDWGWSCLTIPWKEIAEASSEGEKGELRLSDDSDKRNSSMVNSRRRQIVSGREGSGWNAQPNEEESQFLIQYYSPEDFNAFSNPQDEEEDEQQQQVESFYGEINSSDYDSIIMGENSSEYSDDTEEEEEKELIPFYHHQQQIDHDQGNNFDERLKSFLVVATSHGSLGIFAPPSSKSLIYRSDFLTTGLSARQRSFMTPLALRNINRLNISQWVPEISCLVTASQCGIIRVCRLEKYEDNERETNSCNDNQSKINSCNENERKINSCNEAEPLLSNGNEAEPFLPNAPSSTNPPKLSLIPICSLPLEEHHHNHQDSMEIGTEELAQRLPPSLPTSLLVGFAMRPIPQSQADPLGFGGGVGCFEIWALYADGSLMIWEVFKGSGDECQRLFI